MRKLFISVLLCLSGISSAFGQTAITQCDRLAAHPSDPDKVTEGVDSKDVQKVEAIAACQADLKADPKNARLHYQLGRVLFYDKQFEPGFKLILQGAELHYRQAQFVAGYVYAGGQPAFINTPDYCKALPLWQDAAERGHYASQISLARDYLRGKYAACSLKLAPAKLRGYLDAAKPQAKTYYETILIEFLQEQLAGK